MSDIRFRQVNDYAFVHGFVGGYPNFHEADYGCGKVNGGMYGRQILVTLPVEIWALGSGQPTIMRFGMVL